MDLQKDLKKIYEQDDYQVGWPEKAEKRSQNLARPHTVSVVGIDLGDEGKGRIVDNCLQSMLDTSKLVYAIRFQGGNNSGHSVETGGTKLALHLVPSGVLYENVVGIMDRGLVVHPDLKDEVELVEGVVGDIKARLFLSEEAILATDLERAEEVLNRQRQGKAAGGTGRGIGPAYAHHYDRLGFHVDDLTRAGWKEVFGGQYDRYQKEFFVHGLELAGMAVPDFRETKRTGESQTRIVGQRGEYLDRLEHFRDWLIKRDMVRNTHLLHREIYSDLTKGVLFEGAQALGLHPWLGTRPDVTSSDTSTFGIHAGTGLWKADDILDRIGVFKITYTSSVGVRVMPTQVSLGDEIKKPGDLSPDASDEQKWAAYVWDEAHEFGTTTGRPRDILHLDLEMMRYNCHMAGIEVLAGTHLDIAREGEEISVCTHYTRDGRVVPYQPGLRYQQDVVPNYAKLPGWDGGAARRAKSYGD
ncbi:adenylosuccinate synthetase, partial [Patescibacteria group bacterium]|nr:adenylosuccinate synthetase [Patescibacteria group bacterium]